ncbi:pesticidal crystal-like protein Cry17Aa [Mixophyes fleayi]|uniref:pesticidal crystal-like protein Cry17Aa n=1 Tax=Mixophyes fleayi TaxID=3061075 RepID=UPI003F4D99A8
MVSKHSKPWVTTFLILFLFLQGNNCKNPLGGTWNDRMKDILVSITAKIPPIEGIPVGQIISMLLKAFWPASEKDIWSLIKDQVEGLIDQKILEFELQERNNEIRALQKTMEMYVEAQIKEKGSLMSSMIHASNELFYKLTLSNNSVQLIPLVVTHSTEHLMILKERLLHGKKMYDEDNTDVWLNDLEKQISTYKDYMKTTYSKWVDWRKAKITLDVGCNTYPTAIPPFFRFEAYGIVTDQLTKETVKYVHGDMMGTNDKNYFRKICEAVKKNMFGLRNGELLQIMVSTLYLDNFIPDKEDNPSVIPPAMSIASFGPISPSIQIIRSHKFILYGPGNDNTNGEVTKINVREWNIIDGFQVIYNTHSGSFVGNRGGGLLHEVQLNNRRARSLRFCDNNCNMVEVTIDFSDGESTGRLGNRGGWIVSCVNTGGIDTYGLYNVRLAGGGCANGLYQIELDYKAYPTKPSQIDSHNLYSVDFTDKRLKYKSVIGKENSHHHHHHMKTF